MAAMRSFQDLAAKVDPVPSSVVADLAAIERAAGREDRVRERNPNLVKSLAHRARVESVRASSAIEDIVVDDVRLRSIVRGGRPRTRSEEEVAGYRDALDYALGSGATEPYSVLGLLRLHRLLFGATDSPGGRTKEHENRVVDVDALGSRTDRFRTVPVREVEFHLRQLHEGLDRELEAGWHHPILVIGAYVLDMLVIHPFDNGNGRTARLATTLLLNQCGYGVVRYIAIEGLVDRTSDEYYRTLKASTVGWHEGSHDLWPWLGYLVARVAEGYRGFTELVDATPTVEGKAARVREYILRSAAPVFTRDDVRAGLPDVSERTIVRVLADLRNEGRIEVVERGAGARWRRVD